MYGRKYFFWKVVFEDGRQYRDFKYERARELFENEGVKLYAYTKDVYPVVLLVDWKKEG